MNIRTLVGSGDRIGVVVAPFAIGGIALNIVFPEFFEVGGPSPWLRTLSSALLVVGVGVWAWSVVLIVRHVPKGDLITTGPFHVVRHPLYTSVSLLVLPWLGFLLNTWLGAALGLVLYLASRRFEPAEEAELAARFGIAWDRYRAGVLLPRV